MSKRTGNKAPRRPQVNKRELRSKLSQLKKLGAISPKFNAATVKLTKYRQRQVSAFSTVLKGEADFVRLPKLDREAYTRTTAARKFGSVLIVPKEHPQQRTDVIQRGSKNLLRIRTPLGRGEISQIILPYDVGNLIELATAIQNDTELPEELFYNHPLDQYAFALYGHTVKIGFPTKRELTDYILVHYKHLFSGGSGEQAVQHFVLVNYGGGAGEPPEIPEDIAGPKYESEKGSGRRPNARGRTDWYEARKNNAKNERRKKKRARLTGEAKVEYLEAARARAAKSYKTRMEKKQKDDYNAAKF